ncbi:MAG: hypothetical protein ACE5F4_01960 [Candidatus Paceibacteria bacterium]
MDIFHFLNLQYWYCTIYSLFGGQCTFVEAPSSGGSDGFAGFLASLFGILQSVWNAASGIIAYLWDAYSTLAWGLSLFLAFALLFTLAGLLYIRLRELAVYGTLPPETDEERVRNHRWQELLDEAMTSDPKRWRHAILEADRMLGELLMKLGYEGATTPDRMRALPEDAFVTVPQAWEAHRVRNFISQGHSDFILTQREAFRIMKLYEQVFEEFNFI